MARKLLDVTITTEGRDKGKTFRITEMAASKAERWATKCLLAMARGGVQIDEDIANGGLLAVAAVGMQLFGGMKPEDVEPLLDEMFQCAQVVPNPSNDFARALIEDDIEEILTRLQLRKEIFKLHTDFLQAAGSSITGLLKAAT